MSVILSRRGFLHFHGVHMRSVQTGMQRKERRRWNEWSVKGEAGESWQCEKACKGIRGLSCSKRRLCDTKKGRQGGNARAGWTSVEEAEDRRTRTDTKTWRISETRESVRRKKGPFKLLKSGNPRSGSVIWNEFSFMLLAGIIHSCLFMSGDDYFKERRCRM